MDAHIKRNFIGYTITSAVRVDGGWVTLVARGLTVNGTHARMERLRAKALG